MSTEYTPGGVGLTLLRDISAHDNGLSEYGILPALRESVVPELLHHGLIAEVNHPTAGFVYRVTDKGRDCLVEGP